MIALSALLTWFENMWAILQSQSRPLEKHIPKIFRSILSPPMAWIKRPMSCDKAINYCIWLMTCALKFGLLSTRSNSCLCLLYFLSCELCVWCVNKTVTFGKCIHVCTLYMWIISFMFFQTWYLAPMWMWNKGICWVQFRLFVVVLDAKLEEILQQ